jgi:hypothetical protein
MALVFRRMTPDEMDSSGFSRAEDCNICRHGVHQCGGCGAPLDHVRGDTCPDCWRMIFAAQAEPEDEDQT